LSALDDKMVPTAFRLLEKYGKAAVLTLNVDTYDPTTGITTSVAGDPPSLAIKVTPPAPLKEGFRPSSTLLESDTNVFVSAQACDDVVPVVGMPLILAGVTYKLCAVDPIYSGTEIAVYSLWLRA
jgi:hypothetical protein